MHLTGVHLTGVHLTGMHLRGVHLTLVHLRGVHPVILLDWILIGAPGGARLALEVDPLILFVDWSGFGPVELQELQT
jgi:hypothetical protein